MLTAAIAFILAHIVPIATGLFAVIAGFWGGHKLASSSADTKVQTAQAQTTAAQAETQVAKSQAADAQADADAKTAELQAVKNAQTAQDAAAKIPDNQLDQEGQARGLLRD